MWCEKGLHEKLKALDRADVRARLEPWLTAGEIDWMFTRLDKVTAHIDDLIDERGEGAVLFTWKH